MFIQIHMLQSMPPGNLNRDETGQPKKCIFGGVTRARISSQCLKRNIRRSSQFAEAFGGALADRTTYLPRMVAEELRKNKDLGIPEDDLAPLMNAIASRFKKEQRQEESGEEETAGTPAANTGVPSSDTTGQTGQLVFFPQPFAAAISRLIGKCREETPRAYQYLLGTIKPKPGKDEKKSLDATVGELVQSIGTASRMLTVDIGLFGRMTTSDLVVNVEAACQVAHAISTHETVIESDYFTAMDDRKADFATSQMDKAGAAFLGSGETETFYSAAVYYKYLNLDLDALRKHLPSLSDTDAARVAGVLVSAAALSNPTGKQNSFASHGVPQLVLVEVSSTRRPISYANAFLQPVEGPNYLAQSAQALKTYVESVAPAFAPKDVQRFILALGDAKVAVDGAKPLETLDQLAAHVGQATVANQREATT